jgi:hypothetical protein
MASARCPCGNTVFAKDGVSGGRPCYRCGRMLEFQFTGTGSFEVRAGDVPPSTPRVRIGDFTHPARPGLRPRTPVRSPSPGIQGAAPVIPKDFRFAFPIAMLGSRGVGKTSMIAAMKNEFDRISGVPGLQLIPNGQTARDLNLKLIQLKALVNGPGRGYVDLSQSVPPNFDHVQYQLELYHVPSRASMDIVFHDYPGEWLTDPQKIAEVDDMLSRAAIILVALDAPALMELNDYEHEQVNHPADISDALARALRNDNADVSERLVLFVPMRGEKWLQNREDIKMFDRFRDRFQAALKGLQDYEDRISVLFCPIQTLGSVQFVFFDRTDTAHGLSPRFQKTSDDYRPKDCDQPLRYSLLYMLRKMNRDAARRRVLASSVLDNRSSGQRLSVWFWGLFGYPDVDRATYDDWLSRSSALLEVIGTFTDGCDRKPPFIFMQNDKLLRL